MIQTLGEKMMVPHQVGVVMGKHRVEEEGEDSSGQSENSEGRWKSWGNGDRPSLQVAESVLQV